MSDGHYDETEWARGVDPVAVVASAIAAERERCARLCDHESFVGFLQRSEYPRLERAFGDVNDEALFRASRCDYAAFTARAISTDTNEVRDVRAVICVHARMARWIRSGLTECPLPSWKTP